MKVKLERSGGVTGIRRTVTVDATALPPERAAQLRRLVADARLSTFPEHPTAPAGRPDRFVYRLTVEDDAGARAVTVSEDSTSEEMRRLLDWVQATAEA